MSEWQKIETHEVTFSGEYSDPKPVLLWSKKVGHVEIGVVHVYPDGHRKAQAAGFHGDWEFTHWMPLPEPPR